MDSGRGNQMHRKTKILMIEIFIARITIKHVTVIYS